MRLNSISSKHNPYFRLISIVSFCLIIYFLWMDIALYVHLQRWSPPPIEKKSINTTTMVLNSKIDPFSTFNPLTVKLIMIDHMSHYIHDRLARFLVDYMCITRIFPISANAVSFLGLLAALIGSWLTISDKLMYRQFGALLFECRNLADALDGVFSRARKREHAEYLLSQNIKADAPTFASTYGSFGYNVDIIADVIGGAFFCAAIFYRFLKRPPYKPLSERQSPRHAKKSVDINNNENLSSFKYTQLEMDEIPNSKNSESDNQFQVKVSDSVIKAFSAEPEQTNSSSRYFTSKEVKFIVVSFGLRILLTGGIWDHYVHKYHDLLMNFSPNPTLRKFQGDAFKSTGLWIIMWSWRLINGCALFEHLCFSTLFDKLWDYLVWTTYIGWGFLIFLTAATQLHYTELSNAMNRLSALT